MKRLRDDHQAREQRLVQQYEQVAEQLRVEVKERERDLVSLEVKEGYEKQTLARDLKDLKEQLQMSVQHAEKSRTDLEEARRDLQRARDEEAVLRATVAEVDKSRELLVKELINVKDLEADRVRGVEAKKEAELRLQEKLVQSLKEDKKVLEQKVEDLLDKIQVVSSQHHQEHHDTVKYFENLVAQYKHQISRLTQP